MTAALAPQPAATFCRWPDTAVVGPTESIIALLGLTRQHNEHCKAYRWHLYVQGMNLSAREAAVRAWADQVCADARRRRGIAA